MLKKFDLMDNACKERQKPFSVSTSTLNQFIGSQYYLFRRLYEVMFRGIHLFEISSFQEKLVSVIPVMLSAVVE